MPLDAEYFDGKFGQVYTKINVNHAETLEKINETQKEIIKIQGCITSVKKDINEHKATKCENIQTHYKEYHEISWGRVLSIIVLLITIISTLFYLVEKII